jgi:excisionase family DNA binding protein
MGSPCGVPEFATVKQAAEILQVDEKTVRRMLNDGRLVKVKLAEGPSGAVRIPMESLRAPGVPSVPTGGQPETTEGE